jgi:GTP-binding protein SAR1
LTSAATKRVRHSARGAPLRIRARASSVGAPRANAHSRLRLGRAARKLWTSYFPSVDAVIYLVDAVRRPFSPRARTQHARALRAAPTRAPPPPLLAVQVDTERFPEAKKELDGLLSTEALANTPFLILGNKIDMPYAVSEDALRRSLGLLETTGADVTSLPKDIRPIEVFMCSILRKTGYADGLKWLTNFL